MRKKEERLKELRMERKTDWWRKKGKSEMVSLIINVVKLQIR